MNRALGGESSVESALLPRASTGPMARVASSSEEQGGARRSASWLDRWLCRHILGRVGNPAIELTLWDGQRIRSGCGSEHQRILIRDRATLCRLLINPSYQFGDAYADGRIEVDGGLADVLAMLYRSLSQTGHGKGLAARIYKGFRRFTGASLAAARKNIHHHYDLGNDFYKLWLDWNMVYTCAYFAEDSYSLEQAQVAKMDHVCRKVRLSPGEDVVEAGCGWGALALHMAKHFGVKVKAFNVSGEQIRYARQRARREGLANRVQFILDDWRNITGTYDVFVSIGMLEHVGPRYYCLLGDVMNRCLKPGGRGLLHSIGRNRPERVNRWIERHIFPGAYAPTLCEMSRVLEPHDFAILDVENLRLHYAQTLRHWLDRFERSIDLVRHLVDERFLRMWRLYLAGSMVAFQTGGLQLYQVLFNRADDNRIPRTRRHLYDAMSDADAAEL